MRVYISVDMEGISGVTRCDVMFLVGHHAKAGDRAARVERVRRNEIATIDVMPPFDVEVELRDPLRADVRASIETHHPEFEIRGDRRLGFHQDDMALAYRMMCVAQVLEADGRVRGY